MYILYAEIATSFGIYQIRNGILIKPGKNQKAGNEKYPGLWFSKNRNKQECSLSKCVPLEDISFHINITLISLRC